MDGPIEGGDGGGVFSGGSSHGSISTVSKEDNLVLSAEVSSSLAINAHELELGLGLSLGCGGTPTAAKSKSVFQSGSQYARILTAKDFPSKVSKDSSSSSPSIVKVNRIAPCGSKRSAESFSPPRSDVRNQIVGWPPVRPHRMNIIVNRGKSLTAENGKFATAERKNKNVSLEKSDGRNKNDLEKEAKKSQFVKVNMDGIPIGRKIDLNAHSCYETLAQTLDDMFCRPATCTASRQEQGVSVTEATGSLRLLDLLSEFVLTYEDKDGDWMLVGDVPWEMFIFSVKRLKIMRTSEANGLAPTTQQRNEGVRTKPI